MKSKKKLESFEGSPLNEKLIFSYGGEIVDTTACSDNGTRTGDTNLDVFDTETGTTGTSRVPI